MPRGIPENGKKKQSRACKHKFVRLVETLQEGETDPKLKCSWCHMRFNGVGELEAEYNRLKIPYKMVDLERYKREDIYQREYDPTNPKILGKDDFMIGPSSPRAHRSNKLSWSGYRWGQFD